MVFRGALIKKTLNAKRFTNHLVNGTQFLNEHSQAKGYPHLNVCLNSCSFSKIGARQANEPSTCHFRLKMTERQCLQAQTLSGYYVMLMLEKRWWKNKKSLWWRQQDILWAICLPVFIADDKPELHLLVGVLAGLVLLAEQQSSD